MVALITSEFINRSTAPKPARGRPSSAPHGLSCNKMALITTKCTAMRSRAPNCPNHLAFINGSAAPKPARERPGGDGWRGCGRWAAVGASHSISILPLPCSSLCCSPLAVSLASTHRLMPSIDAGRTGRTMAVLANTQLISPRHRGHLKIWSQMPRWAAGGLSVERFGSETAQKRLDSPLAVGSFPRWGVERVPVPGNPAPLGLRQQVCVGGGGHTTGAANQPQRPQGKTELLPPPL